MLFDLAFEIWLFAVFAVFRHFENSIRNALRCGPSINQTSLNPIRASISRHHGKERSTLKRRLQIGLVACLLLCVTSTTAQTNLAHLKAWVGKYPTEKKGKVTRRFFSDLAIRSSLTRLLSREDLALLTRDYSVETPIMGSGDYLTVKVCRPHNCPEQAAFAINLTTGDVYVRMAIDENAKWFSSKGSESDLPRNVREYMEDFSRTEIGSP